MLSLFILITAVITYSKGLNSRHLMILYFILFLLFWISFYAHVHLHGWNTWVFFYFPIPAEKTLYIYEYRLRFLIPPAEWNRPGILFAIPSLVRFIYIYIYNTLSHFSPLDSGLRRPRTDRYRCRDPEL